MQAVPASPEVIETDAVIVGAGPVGLFQVFELGLLEIKAHIVDSLPYPGGQCIELYPDKPIYDIPAVPVCTGKELTDNLLKQIEPFGATFHLGQEVTTVQKQEDGSFVYTPDSGFTGTDSFTYEVSDGTVTTTAIVTITVTDGTEGGGGEGEGEGEGALAAALLSLISDEEGQSLVDGTWEDAVDEAMSQLD